MSTALKVIFLVSFFPIWVFAEQRLLGTWRIAGVSCSKGSTPLRSGDITVQITPNRWSGQMEIDTNCTVKYLLFFDKGPIFLSRFRYKKICGSRLQESTYEFRW